MSDLTYGEKRKIEQLLNMGCGYVLDFSNRTFAEFFYATIGKDIYDSIYDYASGSKANRLRGFWNVEGNYVVGKLLNGLFEHGAEIGAFQDKEALLEACQKIAARLMQDTPVPDLDALVPIDNERDFETVVQAVREAIEKNQPETGLDRLHTFTIKYIRSLCQQRGLAISRDKPVHSLFGEYVKALRDQGYIESSMTERILKASISILEAFNHVRNDRSLAHDNPILNYDEALLIFNHVASSVRFLRSLERRLKVLEKAKAPYLAEMDEIPF
jgi:hypothetical protein